MSQSEKVPLVKCNLCDPSSLVPHSCQVTRLRIANLCCIKEEQLVRQVLSSFPGIEQISINLIGKYAIIKHCIHDCCSPRMKIVEALNVKHLGVSIQEVHHQQQQQSQNEDGTNGNSFSLFRWIQQYYLLLHGLFITALFIIGFILFLISSIHSLISQWIFIISVIFGIFPILQKTLISLFIQKQIDIHCLMIIAIVGALLGGEYFDASLVVALFLDATLLETIMMEQVKNAISISSAKTLPKEAYLANGKTVKTNDLQIGDIIVVRAGEAVVSDGIVTKGDGVIDESALTGESTPVQKAKGQIAYGGTVVQNGYLEIQINKNPSESLVYRLNLEIEEVQADQGQYATLVNQFSQYWTPFIIFATFLLVVIGGGVTNNWWEFVDRGLVLLVLACPCAIVIAAPIPSTCAIANTAKHGLLIRGSTVVEKMNLIDTVAIDKTGTLTKGFFTLNDKKSLSDNQLPLEEEKQAIDDAMIYAAALEQKSTHPLANAILSDYCGCIGEMEEMMLKLPEIKQLKVLDGIGIEGWVQDSEDEYEWKHVAIGNERLFKPFGGKIRLSATQTKKIELYQQQGGETGGNVILFVVIDDEVSLLLSLADTIRPEAKEFVNIMQQEMKLSVNMLTGDHETVAKKICNEVNIPLSQCFSRLLPEDKLHFMQYYQSFLIKPESNAVGAIQRDEVTIRNYISLIPDEENGVSLHFIKESGVNSDANDTTERMETEDNTKIYESQRPFKTFSVENNPYKPPNKHILMIGDGINDSTALAASTVGVAMGSGGTAMAVSAADVVLMTDNLLLLPYALRICRYACRTIIENGIFAISVKVVAIVLAILGLLNLWQAVLIDIGCLIVVVFNGLKVLKYSDKSITDTKMLLAQK